MTTLQTTVLEAKSDIRKNLPAELEDAVMVLIHLSWLIKEDHSKHFFWNYYKKKITDFINALDSKQRGEFSNLINSYQNLENGVENSRAYINENEHTRKT